MLQAVAPGLGGRSSRLGVPPNRGQFRIVRLLLLRRQLRGDNRLAVGADRATMAPGTRIG